MSRLLGRFFDIIMAVPNRRFADDLEKPLSAQERRLKYILAANAGAAFGRRHEFKRMAALSGRSLWQNFRRVVPIRSYAGFADEIDLMKDGKPDILAAGRPEMFALTSGTMGDPKFCPVTRRFVKEHHAQHLLWMHRIYRDHPAANGGKYLILAGRAEMGRTKGGVPFGSMSGKQVRDQSIPVRRRMAVPAAAQELGNPEQRWYATALFALAEKNISLVMSVNPSTLVLLAEHLVKRADALLDDLASGAFAHFPGGAGELPAALKKAFRPDPARAAALAEIRKAEGALSPGTIWPDLGLILTWQGGSSSFYIPRVAASWGNKPQRCLGLRASEGTFTIPVRDGDPAGILAVGGHVVEFAPAVEDELAGDTPTLLANELEVGRRYRLIATTSGGLYRYDLKDLVEVTGFAGGTPELAFVRRAGAMLSVSGEKVTEDQIVEAMRLAGENNVLLNGFTVTWEMGARTNYVLAVEYAGGEANFERRRGLIAEQLLNMLSDFDRRLTELNCEYRSKREDGRLDHPRLLLLADGSYERHRARMVALGRPENQIKPPHLVVPPGPGEAPVRGCPFLEHVKVVARFSPGDKTRDSARYARASALHQGE